MRTLELSAGLDEPKRGMPLELTERLADQTIDVFERLELAERLAIEYGEVGVLLRQTGKVNGVSYEDSQLPYEDYRKIMQRLNIGVTRPLNGAHYIKRASSDTNQNIYLQVQEGPLDDRLYPSGVQTWDDNNFTRTFELVVMPPVMVVPPSWL